MNLSFIHPGSMDQITGGTLYDKHILEYLRRYNSVDIIEVGGQFPLIDDATRDKFAGNISELADIVLIDGLAGPLLNQVNVEFWKKHSVYLLFHNPIQYGQKFEKNIEDRLKHQELHLIENVDGVICTSKYSLAYIRESTSQDNILLAIPGKPIDLEGRDTDDRIPTSLKSDGTQKLLIVGTVTPRKNVDLVLNALQYLDQPVSLDIVGPCTDSDYLQQIRDIIREIPDHTITIHGEQEDITKFYQNADLFIHVPIHESYGMVLVEAMAYGLPIICSDVDGIPQTVGDAAIFVSQNTPKELADRINSFLASGSLQSTYQEKSLKRYRQLPSWEETGKLIADFILDH